MMPVYLHRMFAGPSFHTMIPMFDYKIWIGSVGHFAFLWDWHVIEVQVVSVT